MHILIGYHVFLEVTVVFVPFLLYRVSVILE